MPDRSQIDNTAAGLADFAQLTPFAVNDAVEDALGVQCTSLCRPLASYINRVYDIGLADGRSVIAKFYRPRRWTEDALLDELDFLEDLDDGELPVVPPLAGPDDEILHQLGDIFFAVFPKRGGRPLDELTLEEWPQIGRLLARLHVIGAQHDAENRIRLHPLHSTRAHLEFIISSGTLPAQLGRAYCSLVERLIDELTPLFEDTRMIRLHGDCHHGNILRHPDKGFHLLDFDDMCTGPAIQDLWLLLPDRMPAARPQLDALLTGYDTFLELPWEQIRLIEPLRAMRFIHYTAWCACQKADGAYSRLAEDWGTATFWQRETDALEIQRREVHDALS